MLAALFAVSGCAALLYELVWFQMLQLVIGSTAVSLAVLLASFMGGMCLGSILVPRWVGATVHPVRVWAMLELGTGVLGIVVFFAVPGLATLYVAVVPGGFAGILWRALVCAVLLLPPTFLMGATLPIIGRLASADPQGASRVGLIYGANSLGAVLGALLAGFVVLRLFNATVATCLAAGLNGSLAAIGFWLRLSPSVCQPAGPRGSEITEAPKVPWGMMLAIGLSGFCALGAEVVWTRLLSLMLGGTTYSFSIILAVFLLGLSLGSAAGALVARRAESPRLAFAGCQLLLAAAISWTALMLAKSLPYWPINPLISKSVWYNFQVDLLRCLWAILPATCLWGASFPLALASAVAPGQDSSRLVGRIYAANTLGAILGAILFSIVLIPALGSQQVQRVLLAASFLAGALAYFGPRNPAEPAPSLTQTPPRRTPLPTRIAFGVAVSFVLVLLLWSLPRLPWELVAYGRYLPQKTELGRVLYVGEGRNASVAVTELDGGVRNFHVSGKIEASTDKQDMRLQRMLGHIPALFHPDPRSVLVVGCGAGVTAGSFLVHPGIEKVSLCEIEPLIPKAVAHYFGEENYDVVRDPRVRIIYDDARHFIFTTRDRFDIITSDPIHPWVKGAATLYTKEYFELCKRHLNPGGMVSQWVPLYESDMATVKSELATFFDVFPEGSIWSNEDLGEGYDLVLLGQVEPLAVDLETLARRLGREDHRLVAKSLHEVGIRSAFGLVANYAGQARDLEPWLRNSQLNRDRDLRLQYLAGLGLNDNASDFIYSQMSSYRRFPQEIFVGSNQWSDALRRTLEPPKSKSP